MSQPAATRPNILFIVADDLGWADLSVYGQTEYATPHLDCLATQGVRFTQAYANSAVCSATRFALMTGRYQYRLPGGLEEPLTQRGQHLGLPPEHPTLPSLLKAVGYTTALIGKWHLGAAPHYGPLKSGYDRFFGNYGGAIDYFTHKPAVGAHVPCDLYEGEVPVERVGYYTQILADEAAQYIRTHGAQGQAHPWRDCVGAGPSGPFFVSLHFTAPHWPWEGPEDEAVARNLKDLFHNDGGNLRTYATMVRALDAAVGQVLAAQLGYKPSDTIELAGEQHRISGIVSTGGDEDHEIVAPISLAQHLAGRPGAVRQIYVSALTKPEDELARRNPKTLSPEMYDRWYCSPYAQSIAYQLQEAIPNSHAEMIRQVAQSEGTVLARIKGLMLLITLAALFASALAVSSAMATAIFERRAEVVHRFRRGGRVGQRRRLGARS